MNIALWVERNGRLWGERPGIALGSATYASHRDWARRVRSVAAYLLEHLRCKPGDRVAIAMQNAPQYLEALYGIWHAGLVAVPVNARLHQKEFEYIFAHSQAAAAVVGPELSDTIAPIAPAAGGPLKEIIVADGASWRRVLQQDGIALVDRGPDDLAWLFYTSGTTGRPKGACLTHRNLLAMSLSYFADIDPIAPGESILHAAPLSHGSGLYGLPHVAKGATNIIPESGHFQPAEIAALLQAWNGVSFFVAPTMVRRLTADPAFAAADHDKLKTIIYGGAPMYVEDLKRSLALLGPRLAQIYGQGESPMTITALSKSAHAAPDHPKFDQRLASVGSARTDVEVRIVDAEDRDVPIGENGEIVVRGDVVMAGYLDDHAATAVALRGGWLHTGDIGSLDSDGFLTLKDRAKDVIISGGSNIYPREVEEVLLRHSAVREVSVVGMPDVEWGESVVAFIVGDPVRPAPEAELDGLCLGSIARFKRPKRYVFVTDLPKNAYGKVLKTELRAMLAQLARPGQA